MLVSYERELGGRPLRSGGDGDPPARDLPARDLPARDLPARDLPARDLPARDLPARDLPARDPPARDLPARDPPRSETDALLTILRALATVPGSETMRRLVHRGDDRPLRQGHSRFSDALAALVERLRLLHHCR
ncbi:hypothetical protein ACFY64_30370 [Streptomyces collinus]|uniref:hypothetical protein n=1 Tax=Streptomyces collinus TaxID=42684 RepID=UPI0036AE9D5C